MKDLVKIKVAASLSNENEINTQKYLQILNNSIQRFDNPEKVSVNLVSNNLIEVSGASGLSLHQFSLECEMLGKKLDYVKQTTFFIS